VRVDFVRVDFIVLTSKGPSPCPPV
jgi:hypothetical protein